MAVQYPQPRQSAASSSLFSVIGILVVMQIVLGLIVLLVYNRQWHQEQAGRDVKEMWGEEQTVIGPMLMLPYEAMMPTGKDRTYERVTRYYRIFPNRLSVEGSLRSEVRRRGIFDVPLYQASLQFSGAFEADPFPDLLPESLVRWQDAVVAVYISDPRGLQEPASFAWNGGEAPFQPGLGIAPPARGQPPGGVHVRWPGPLEPGLLEFSFSLKLNGSVSLDLAPLGEATRVDLQSDWPTPSFQGAWLPVRHQPSDGGFQARWDVAALGRNYPQLMDSRTALPEEVRQSAFGVALLSPTDPYRMVIRSLKYEILFFTLTFALIWLFQVLSGIRIHPMHYLMVGAALAVFYLLELSLSEHIGFTAAYLAAAGGVVVLVWAYMGGVLGSGGRRTAVAATVAGLYALLYVLLASQDYALLLGFLLLFAVLTAAMLLTRNVDWDSVFGPQADAPAARDSAGPG